MKVTHAAVFEPRESERKRLVEGLRKAGLKVTAALEPDALGREQLVLLGPTLEKPAQSAKQVRKRQPEALVLAAQKKLGKAAHADGVVPLPLSPLDLKVRLPELMKLHQKPAARAGGEPHARPGDGILDPFTAFYTFAHFKEVLFIEVKRARRYGFPLSMAIAGFDNFGNIRDIELRGQLFGGLAMAVRRSLRDTDYPVQYGPTRVLLLMPHTDLQGALVVSRRICERVARATLSHGDEVLHPTISMGLSCTPPPGGEVSFADLARQAQLAFDEALAKGGNRVEFWDSAEDRAATEPQSE
jgi:diguanylate cyclase (GGDEF)-like protein